MEKIIEMCMERVVGIYEQFDASHDFDHIARVMKNAEEIVQTLPHANLHVVKLAALLHDIEDPKYIAENSDLTVSDLLQSSGVDNDTARMILETIKSVSFNGGNEEEIRSIEGAIVRDADRLDAIGAIGIARTFAYGGAKGRKLYDANEIARTEMSEAEYRSTSTSSVTHFYEKLLLLKDLMVTEEGKRLAEERHRFMVNFLEQLNKETGL